MWGIYVLIFFGGFLSGVILISMLAVSKVSDLEWEKHRLHQMVKQYKRELTRFQDPDITDLVHSREVL
ncbi:MAG: hypothetical protein K9N57_00210 [Candidatus Marinimicrobia bacterium]|nr:hypothetical protein [Candidatus Neomarinimicrobiota bacterium]